MKLAICLPFILTGCVLCPPKPDPKPQSFNIDERLMQECAPITDIVANPKPSDILKQHGADVLIYKDCADSKRELIDAIRKVSTQGI